MVACNALEIPDLHVFNALVRRPLQLLSAVGGCAIHLYAVAGCSQCFAQLRGGQGRATVGGSGAVGWGEMQEGQVTNFQNLEKTTTRIK